VRLPMLMIRPLPAAAMCGVTACSSNASSKFKFLVAGGKATEGVRMFSTAGSNHCSCCLCMQSMGMHAVSSLLL
jgi:hypothetical protein